MQDFTRHGRKQHKLDRTEKTRGAFISNCAVGATWANRPYGKHYICFCPTENLTQLGIYLDSYLLVSWSKCYCNQSKTNFTGSGYGKFGHTCKRYLGSNLEKIFMRKNMAVVISATSVCIFCLILDRVRLLHWGTEHQICPAYCLLHSQTIWHITMKRLHNWMGKNRQYPNLGSIEAVNVRQTYTSTDKWISEFGLANDRPKEML